MGRWTHDGCPDTEEGIIAFAVVEGTLTIDFPKETLFPIFILVHPVIETTCVWDFPLAIGFMGKLEISKRV